ncbi:MaoC family dehydratase [Spirosoma sp. KCTC 42546]|uniref:MaoC family dehydratase n=1 Tax=Spirosoma sp. KCTC 42546 TaxID=2520506 RepID=UPI0011586BCC|nr:MaoC family dehydratase [Spirosoma sp. KCTC 42546]QDK81680.1 MaoC family dehydratase [Spirosoma sp. KCTC 42546]
MEFGLNAIHRYAFRFSQAEVADFARVTGDNNPLHLDPDFAAQTPFKRPIIHGMLGASVFTKVLGTEFPGYGSVYLGQTLEFLRPMFVDTDYEATFTVQSIDPAKHTAQILGEIRDVKTGKVTTKGIATLMHKEKINAQREDRLR